MQLLGDREDPITYKCAGAMRNKGKVWTSKVNDGGPELPNNGGEIALSDHLLLDVIQKAQPRCGRWWRRPEQTTRTDFGRPDVVPESCPTWSGGGDGVAQPTTE